MVESFKTYEEQLQILRDRGLIIENDSEAISFLQSENYYNFINGYKDLFLQVDNDSKPITPEKYIQGTRFEEIKALYLLNRDLRSTLLRPCIIFENSIKSIIAYEFCQKFPESNAYLNQESFSGDLLQIN